MRKKHWQMVVLVVGAVVLGGTAGWKAGLFAPTSDLPSVHVYKSAYCGCCAKWVDHLEANGFAVTVENTEDLNPIKAKYGVKAGLQSCHTALVDGYVIEGHIPADVVKQFLKERPAVRGLAVPGMPIGSPGMEGSYSEPYDILTFDDEGKTTVYAQR